MAGSARPLVLVVEDERDVQDLLRLALEAEGYAVDGVQDGASAVRAVLRQQPDAVLLDLALPGMNGFEVLAELQRHQSTAKVPVIVMSIWADPSVADRCIAAGATEVLPKPFDLAWLIAKIEAATGVPGLRAAMG